MQRKAGEPETSEETRSPYDPLANRMRLMEALWGEFEQWSRRAREADKPDPYVTKILQMLEQSMQKCDDLLERLKLLSPEMCGPEVNVDLSLCGFTKEDASRLPGLMEKIRIKLEESAMPIIPAKPRNETELLSQGRQHGAGSPIDVEFRERGETR